jgi:hypothetical protein
MRDVVRYQAMMAARKIIVAFTKDNCDIAAMDEITASPVVNRNEFILPRYYYYT